MVLLQGQATAILAWIYGMGNKYKDTLKQSSATGTGHNDTHIPIWRGQAQNFNPLDRRDSGYICGKILKLSALRD